MVKAVQTRRRPPDLALPGGGPGLRLFHQLKPRPTRGTSMIEVAAVEPSAANHAAASLND